MDTSVELQVLDKTHPMWDQFLHCKERT